MPTESPFAGIDPHVAFAIAQRAELHHQGIAPSWVKALVKAFEYEPKTRRYYLDEREAALLGLKLTKEKTCLKVK